MGMVHGVIMFVSWWQVLLYGDDDYDQGHVVTVLCKVR